jgi:diadenosine tetraphosphatase ApaH/serine/threonine PP2A family protein phosphatase
MRMKVNLLGNFDYAVLTSPDGFCRSAERSVLWTQTQLKTAEGADKQKQRRAFLESITASFREGDVLFVHGSASRPLNEYLFREDTFNQQKMERIWASFDRICFSGHTHIPGVFLKKMTWEFIYSEECEKGFPIGNEKLICNVGAVGQPRDGDKRACYALFDGERIWLRRVAYDIDATIRKVHAIEELDDFIGDRLREGR